MALHTFISAGFVTIATAPAVLAFVRWPSRKMIEFSAPLSAIERQKALKFAVASGAAIVGAIAFWFFYFLRFKNGRHTFPILY